MFGLAWTRTAVDDDDDDDVVVVVVDDCDGDVW